MTVLELFAAKSSHPNRLALAVSKRHQRAGIALELPRTTRDGAKGREFTRLGVAEPVLLKF